MTKLAILPTLLILFATTTAFSPTVRQPSLLRSSSSTSWQCTVVNLFGSKNKPSGDQQQQQQRSPGMLDQLAMFKKAQEIAQKKASLDKELSNEKIVGTAANSKISITVRYVPPQLPTNPTPGYEATAVDIDDQYFQQVSCEELSAALVEAIRDGEKKAMEAVAEKYKSLEQDMQAILGGMGAGGISPAQ